MTQSFVDIDIQKHERAKQRALALGFTEYAAALDDVLTALRKVKELDDSYTGNDNPLNWE